MIFYRQQLTQPTASERWGQKNLGLTFLSVDARLLLREAGFLQVQALAELFFHLLLDIIVEEGYFLGQVLFSGCKDTVGTHKAIVRKFVKAVFPAANKRELYLARHHLALEMSEVERQDSEVGFFVKG